MAQKIEDAGEVIAGARKFGANGHLTLDALEGMSTETAATEVTKDRVWNLQEYGYEDMARDGMDPVTVAMVKIMRDRLAAKPRFNIYQLGTRTIRDPNLVTRDFVKMMSIVRDTLTETKMVKEPTDLNVAVRTILNDIEWGNRNREPETQHLLYSVYKGKQFPLQLTNKDYRKAQELVKQGFPSKVPAWRKGVDVSPMYNVLSDRKEYALFKGKRLIERGFQSEEEALTWLKENNQGAPGKPKRTRANEHKPERPHLAHVQRQGGADHRNGKNIEDGESFIENFGFRGVQFGEWLPNSERQEVLNHAHDALMDLAEFLGCEPQHLSLGGTLAISFGSRGKGKAMAHYEAGQRVLNLTRLKGAGALAHEFFHAFDHWSGNPDGRNDPPAHPGGIVSGSGWHGIFPQRSEYLTNLDPDQAAIWEKLVTMSYKRPIEELSSRMAPTSYYREAKRLDGGSTYWCRPNEMLARAFEAWVYDSLKERAIDSPYLVHGVEEDRFAEGYKGNPYPTGEERQHFNNVFQDLIAAMKPDLTDAWEQRPNQEESITITP